MEEKGHVFAVSRQGIQPVNTRRRTLTVLEAARILGISRTAMYQAIQQGVIRARRLGGRWLIPEGEIDRFLMEEDDAPTAT